jgi:preprotein translocase subunit SecY
VPVEFAGRRLGSRLVQGQSTDLRFKINSAGLIPTVVAPWLYLLPLTVVGLVFDPTSPWLATLYRLVSQGHLPLVILSAVAIVILTFVYTSFVIDPDHAAASLKKHGAVIPGIEPGEPTAAYLDGIVTRTSCVGAIYLAAIFLIPELLHSYGQAPFYFGGTSVLVAVCTILDIKTQVRDQSLTKPGGEQG